MRLGIPNRRIQISNLKFQISNSAFLALALFLLLASPGCGRKPGVIFSPVNPPIVWPPAPAPARVAYVGKLETSADLKAGESALQGLGRIIFGKKDSYSMLTPFAVATDGADRVFVADTGSQVVHVFDLKTRRYSRWTPEPAGKRKRGAPAPMFSQPVGVAWDSGRAASGQRAPTLPSPGVPEERRKGDEGEGRLIVSDSLAGIIYLFNSEGKMIGKLGEGVLQRPTGIVVDRQTRRIFVADVAAHQVVVFSAEGELVQRIGVRGGALGQFNYPTNVAIDEQGRLYVSDSLNFRVQQFSPDLKPLRQIGQQGDVSGTFSQPKGIAIDPEGHLYAVDSRFENVQIFDDEGRFLLPFGQEGHGPGEFWLPAGICIDPRGRIFVANPYNRRIEVFEYLFRPDVEPETRPAETTAVEELPGPPSAIRPFESVTRPSPRFNPGPATRPSLEVQP